MSQIAFVTWNGGGNLGPALPIARELRRRDHRAAFLGQETQRPAIEAAGHAFTGCTPDPQRAGPPATAAERQRLLMAGTWLNMSLADDLAAMLAREPADAVVIDCMLAGVLARSAEFGAPAAVLVPGLYHSVLPVRDAMLAAGLGLLARAGLPAPDPAAMRWENKDLVLVTSLHELDGVTADLAPNVRYVGPAFAWPPAPRGWRSPADHRRTHRSARRRHHRILPGTGTRTPRRRRACAGHPVLPAGRTPARPDHRPARRSRRRRLSPAGLRGTARGRPAPGDHHNAGDRTDAKSLKP